MPRSTALERPRRSVRRTISRSQGFPRRGEEFLGSIAGIVVDDDDLEIALRSHADRGEAIQQRGRLPASWYVGMITEIDFD